MSYFAHGSYPQSANLSLSVAMATYNGEKFLSEQLDSLAAQTLKPAELIVCDDRSTDATINIVAQFANRAAFPVRYFENSKRLGWRENFLRAASLCNGELIAFCDQDDVWFPEKLQRCTDVFSDPDVVLCSHRVDITDQSLKPIRQLNQSIRKANTLSPLEGDPFFVYLGFTQVFRSSLLALISSEARPRDEEAPDHQVAHDIWICFLAFVFGKTARLTESLAYYRQHGNQATAFGTSTLKKRGLSISERVRMGRVAALDRFDNKICFARQRVKLLRAFTSHDAAAVAKSSRAADYFDNIIYHHTYRENLVASGGSKLFLGRMLIGALFDGMYSEYKRSRKFNEVVKDLIYEPPSKALK
jgi:glycosyltransferase involved in cell wall biosynthesis